MSLQLPERKEPKKVVNPHQKLYERWRLLKGAAAANALDKNTEYVPEQIKPTSSKYASESSTHSAEPSSSSKNDTQVNGNGKLFKKFIFYTEMLKLSIKIFSINYFSGRIRIAHVPYAMSLALEKKKVLESASNAITKTAAQTAKTGSRVAHVPLTVN